MHVPHTFARACIFHTNRPSPRHVYELYAAAHQVQIRLYVCGFRFWVFFFRRLLLLIWHTYASATMTTYYACSRGSCIYCTRRRDEIACTSVRRFCTFVGIVILPRASVLLEDFVAQPRNSINICDV